MFNKARDTLAMMMETQIKRRKKMTAAVLASIEDAKEKMKALGSEIRNID